MKDIVMNYLKDGTDLTALVMILGYWLLIIKGVILSAKTIAFFIVNFIKEEWDK